MGRHGKTWRVWREEIGERRRGAMGREWERVSVRIERRAGNEGSREATHGPPLIPFPCPEARQMLAGRAKFKSFRATFETSPLLAR